MPAPPPSSTTQSPKGIHDQTQSVSAMLVRQGESTGEEEWCAEQELKGQETEIGVQMHTEKKIKRTRKRTKKNKTHNRGRNNAKKKTNNHQQRKDSC